MSNMPYIQWLRARVGRRKVFMVFGCVILQDENGRFLLQQRTDFDFWGLPGGSLELDEDIESCTRRELREETGLTVGPLHLTGIYSDPKHDVTYPNGDQIQQLTFCFTGVVNGGQMQVDGVESRAQAFFDWPLPPHITLPLWYQDMLTDMRQGQWPVFSPPFTQPETADQIARVRPYVGNDLIIGVGASALVWREDGRILMVQRRDNGHWLLPAGYANLGENLAYTAVRETKEETGLDIYPERILGIFSAPQFHHTYPNGHQVKDVGVMFRARLVGGTAVADGQETAQLAWMTPAEMLPATPPALRDYFRQALTYLHSGHFVL